MTGALWALTAGLGFGIFQTINRKAVKGMDVFVATFLQLLVSAIVLGAVSFLTEDLSAIRNAPVQAHINFALAGLFHFAIGWTFLNTSQKRIGAARTGALIGTTPLFAAVLALITLNETLDLIAVIGIVVITAGAFYTNNLMGRNNSHESGGWLSLLIAFGAPICWSISPIFIRYGLEGLDSPLLGVTVGITASVLGYGVALGFRHLRSPLAPVSSDALSLKIIAGILVGLSTWVRWVALDLTTVAAVLALSLVSIPTVNLLTRLMVDRRIEQVTKHVWIGSVLIICGSLVLILF